MIKAIGCICTGSWAQVKNYAPVKTLAAPWYESEFLRAWTRLTTN